MLPRSTSTLIRPQSRSLWWYTSQLDPIYHRMSRCRTLKTRAKMLHKIRRLFPPKHIRWASHVGRPRWSPEQETQKPKAQEADQEADQANRFELSQREKEWKDHMAALRKRINQDPYEAVFGRRFEPFWAPLVPQWIKEDIGLQSKDASEAKASSTIRPQHVETAKTPYRPLEPEPVQTKRQVNLSSEASENQSVPARYSYDPKKTSVDVNSDSPNGQQTSYSYGATTTWDSWTKKASRVEWDSTSGEKRRYEYDPISNRMVQVNGPPESEVKKVEDALKDYPARSQSPLMSHGWQSGLGNKTSDSASIDFPAKTSENTRQAISVPTQNSNGQKTSVYFPSIDTSVGADMPKPSSLTTHERYPDSLTASDVRASVGSSRAERIPTPVREEERACHPGKPDLHKMSQWDQAEHRVMLNEELYDITKQKQRLLKQESDAFHIEKIPREMGKLELRASDLHRQLDALDSASAKPDPERSTTITAKLHNASTQPSAKLQPTLERMPANLTSAAEDPDDSAAHESTGDFGGYNFNDIPKASAVVSRPSKHIQQNRPSRDDPTQAENDALRKSGTSMVERLREKRSLEDRVQSEVLGRKSAPRWIDVMNARRAAKDARKSPEEIAIETRDAAKNERLAKANALLQVEIDEQKNRMSAHEHRHPSAVENTPLRRAKPAEATSGQSESQRYQDKIRDLRKELDIAYKQSSTNAEGHVDTIRKLEKKLQTSLDGRSDVSDAEKKKYIKKIKTLREKLDTTFRQSSINAEMQVDRIRELERELENARQGSNPMQVLQAEGDMSVDVTKFAKDSSKWYKQAASVHAKGLLEVDSQLKSHNKERDAALSEHELRAGSACESQATRQQESVDHANTEPHPIDQALAEYERRATQRKRDQDLVHEARDIYESKYGTIDLGHRQTSVDKALEEHEQEKKLLPTVDEALREHEQKAPLQPSVDKALEEYKVLQPSVDKALAEHEQKKRLLPSVDKALEEHEHKTKPQSKAASEVFGESGEQRPTPTPLSKELDEYDHKHGYKTDCLDDSNRWYSAVDHERLVGRVYEEQRRLDGEKKAREAGIAEQEKEAHEAQSAMNKEFYGTRSVDTDVQHPIKAVSNKHSIQWQEPPVYKVLAYDSGNDFLVTSTTSTNFTGKETPISIPEALSQLYQPARFIPEFAELQKQNFQVIHGTRDLLVLRKAKTAEPAAEETTLQDHGLITPSAEPTSARSAPKVNPVDKTGFQEPATGSFASPTGFVGDRWEPEAPSMVSDEAQAVNSALNEYEVNHYPRVIRQEHVFSGGRLGNRGSSSSSSQSSNKKKEEKEQRRKYGGWRRSAKWALISGVAVGVAAYSIGAAAERSREKDMERWQKILQDQRALGGLGADGKRLRDGGSGVFWR